MLSAPLDNTQIVRLATQNRAYAIEILTQESLHEGLGIEQILTILASHEDLALAYLRQQTDWTFLDGLALSILCEKSENVALFVLSHPLFRQLLNGVDLARIGQVCERVALTILQDAELCSRLKSPNFCAMAENQFETATMIIENPDIFKGLDPNDLGRLCKKHPTIAQKLLNNKSFVRQCDGSTLALMAECHEELVCALLEDPNREEQLDSAALVILGRHHESMARKIYTGPFVRKLGAFGLARMAKHHLSLALEVLENQKFTAQFSGACFEQLSECHEQVATLIFDQYRERMAIDEIAMMGKYHFSVAKRIVADSTLKAQLNGKHLVSMGQNHPLLATHILEDEELRSKAAGQNIGLLGLRSYELANRIIKDKTLRASLVQLDLANLCKNYMFITLLTLNAQDLKRKISAEYYQLLEKRIETMRSVCSFAQIFMQRQLLEEAPAFLPMQELAMTRSSSPPLPDVDDAFVRQFQSLILNNNH